MLKRIQAQLADTAGLQRLRSADPTQLGSMLRNEHPQAIALILSHLQPTQTAAVLQEIDPALGAEVLYRMATMSKVAPEMLALIEKAMMSEDLAPQQGLTTSGGPHAVASILNVVPSTLEKALLDRVAERDAELCEQVRNLMFVFEDIASLDQKSLQRLLRDVDQKELALALKGASRELQTNVFAAMSSRAQQSLKEELEMLGPQRKRDIEAAQTKVVATVRKLEDSGELVLAGTAEDMVA
jgi:flagellar motor switch protein FliG